VIPSFAVNLKRLQVALSHDEKKFNHEVIIDIFTLEGNSTLSVVDRDTRYVAAIFLATVTAESVWQAMLQCWSLRYLGHPFVIRHDQGTQFTAVGFQKWAGEAGITCHPVATEQANSMGIGERIHSPLRRTYLKLRQEHPNMSKDLLLDAAVKAHNDTSGVNGLVPTLLVYGSFPRLPIRDENIDSPSNSERASMRSLAMAEYSKAIDELRSKLTENAQSPTVPVGLRPHDLVLVWKKALKKWDGPLPLISETPVVFYVRDRRGVSMPYAKTSVKLYREGIRVEHLLPPPI
jgi:hypothetical protein